MGKRVARNVIGSAMSFVAVVLLIAGASACGDDGDGTSGTGGTSGASGMGATGGTGGSTGGTGGSTGGTGGSTGGTGGGGDNNVGPDEICTRLAEIQCAAEADCCDAPGRDIPTCETAMRTACEMGGAAAASDPIVGFDQDALETAFDELETRTATCDPAIATWAITADGFLSAFAGTRASGESCAPEGGDDATIAQITSALASCQNGATTACLPGTDGSYTCTARAAADGACFSDLNCMNGLTCGGTGTCVARKAAGEECDEPNECVTLLCADGTCAEADDEQAAYCLKED